MSAKEVLPNGRLLDLLTSLRIARDGVQQCRRECNERRQAALDWMRQDPKRTLGEACSYVGIDHANDEAKVARRRLRDAVDALLHIGADLEARHGKRVQDGTL